ncbi:hypothetical protein NX059_009118 [Plenodomus lindquistii]|nr:hypothetical protein NX059_009118 [Plenodomus lindquistii]
MAALAPLGAQVRPYKDYLTPALHQRFTHASGYTLFLCYLIAAWQGEVKNLYWMFTPFGYTGLRTLILFIPALTIYVLRVAQWHVGTRHTVNPAATVYKYLFRSATIFTPAFYVFSSWIFVEAYLWSRAPGHKLGTTELGREYERIKLNERRVYLHWAFFVLALAQAGVHLWKDYDKIDIPALKPDNAAAAATKKSPKPYMVLFRGFPSIAAKAASLAGASWVAASASYFLVVRRPLWAIWYPIARNLWSLAKTSKPTGLSPYAPLVIQIITEGFLLVLMWEVVNKAFDLYIAQEPLKNDKPITDDSKDPNGTLLNGLKSKKDAVKAIAFWELALITSSFPTRRSTIYSEVERKKGETFQQITSICLSEIKLLIERLNMATDPNYIPTPPPTTSSTTTPTIALVPQISQPLRDDKSVTTVPPAPTDSWSHLSTATTGIVKAHSSPTNSRDALARDALQKGLIKAKQGKQHATTFLSSAYSALVASPLGTFFHTPLHRTLNVVVLGAPYSRASMLCNAITALTNLTTYSMAEDKLGRYQNCVADIIRTFTKALLALEGYVDMLGTSFESISGGGGGGGGEEGMQSVLLVREALRVGLGRIVDVFEVYLDRLGVSRVEIGEVRKALGRREGGGVGAGVVEIEMVEARR